ncbi:hypothetical protein FBALC1_13157 [Flavobacteriales bacterium ALC-1]|nr:hypothetical protein FBALC1_13157 [Flavobacteriales bacterium ALC-1]
MVGDFESSLFYNKSTRAPTAMKTKINHLFLFALFALISFTACQDEAIEIDNPSAEETIVANSSLATLMSRTTANFGAADNILDGSSCFSVELPVTIIISDITITIETEEDLELLESLLDDFNGDDYSLDFVFPITIIFSDYTELVIENVDQFENFINECDGDNDVIECVDFVYPISFSVFNSDFNLIDTVVIENDQALYAFLDELEDDENVLIVSLNYPVALEYANGETVEVNTNQELADAIEAAGDDCEEENECIEEEVTINLVECPWEVYLYTNDDLENLDGPYNFTFSEDGNVVIEGVFEDSYTTTWELTETDNGLELNIASFYYYEQQFGNWLVVECDDDDLKFEHLTVDGTGLFFDQDCEDDLDCSITDISSILQECPWDFTDGSGNFSNHQMIFNANGDIQITEGIATSAIGGEWNLSITDSGLILSFSELTAFQDTLGGDWLIVECDDDRIELIKGNQDLVLEQDCESDESPFDCFDDFEIVECNQPNNVPVFNLSANTIGLIDCPFPFTASFHVTQEDATNNINPIDNTESYGTLVAQVYLRIETESGNYEIFTVYLNTEDCNYFECYGNYNLSVCDDEDGFVDGFGVFDLNLIFSNCPNDDIAYSFYLTIADAETQSNPLSTIFTNTVSPSQTIYSRVYLAGNPDIFEIFSHNLIVEDCTGGCSEEDVDTILVECTWNINSFNGSNDLAEWNFDFESVNNIVVIYTDTDTIDATWTTSQTSDGVLIEFSNVNGSNIQAITGVWLVVECTEGQLVLHDVNNSDNEIVLDRTCN